METHKFLLDQQKSPLAELIFTEEQESPIALLPLRKLTGKLRKQLQDLLDNPQDIEHLLQETDLKCSPLIESEPASPAQRHIAKTLYHSNLIEDIAEAPEEALLRQISMGTSVGHVGAWLQLKDRVHSNEPIRPEDIFHAHRLLFEEQEWLGHGLPDEDLSITESMQIIRELNSIRDREKFSDEQFQQLLEKKQQEQKDRLHQQRSGTLRTEWITIAKTPVPPPTEEALHDIITDLNKGIQRLQNEKASIENILEFAAKHHLAFEELHPFIDGNGRIGRLLVNTIMAAFGQPELFLPFSRRQEYYQCFKTGDHQAMTAFFRSLYESSNNT